MYYDINKMQIQMGNERLYLRSPNINVCFKARITGSIDRGDFINAIESVCKRHPMLKVNVKIDTENNAWYLQGNGSIGIEFYNYDDKMHWKKWYEETDNIPFDFQDGGLVKIGVICGSTYTDIVILGHHILGDGIGYLNLMKDILSSLSGRLDESVQITFKENSLKIKTKLGFLPKLYAKKLNKAWVNTREKFSENDYLSFFKEYREKYPPGMFLASLTESNLSELISACKKSKITVNAAIATAFVAAVQDTSNKYKERLMRLGVAASIRNELITPMHDSMGNYITGISIKVKYDYSKSFTDNARLIGKLLRKKLENPKSRYLAINFLSKLDKDFVESAIYASYGNDSNPASKKLGEIIGEQANNKGIGISNLGKQCIGEFEKFNLIDLLFIPPAFPANLINIGVMSINGQLNFCLRYAKSEISDTVIEQICMKAISYLK